MRFEMILDWNVVAAFKDAGVDPAPYRALSERGPFPASVICPCHFGDKKLAVRLKVFSTNPWAHIEFDVDDAAVAKAMKAKFFRYSTEDQSGVTYKSWKVREITKNILQRDGSTLEEVYYKGKVLSHRCIEELMGHYEKTDVAFRRDITFLLTKNTIAPGDRVWVARWMAQQLAGAKGDCSHLIEQFHNGGLVVPELADDFIAILKNRSCDARDGCLFDLFVQTKDRRALEVAVSVLNDEPLTEAALRCIGRRKAKQHVDKVRTLLKHRSPAIRQQAKKTMKQLGFPGDAPPAPIHLVKKRSALPRHFQEWSSNLDLEQLQPTLMKVAKCVDDGFGPLEISEVEGVVEEMKEEQTKIFHFPITYARQKAGLWLVIFLDDVDSPDVEIHSDPSLIKELEKRLK